MATIHIDDSNPFPNFPVEPENRRESFADFCKREAAGLRLESDEMEQENREQEELNALQKKRFERKGALLYNNLDLILRHREEIIATPRYANIDVQYAIKGGGLYVGHLSAVRHFNFVGTLVSIGLKLSSLLEIWDNELWNASAATRRSSARSRVRPFRAVRKRLRFAPSAKKKSSSRTVALAVIVA